MKEVLNNLREQHQKILMMLDRPEQVEELIHFVEEVHHPLEEIELFPFMKDKPCLSQGGPRCSLYMGMRLELDPLTRVRGHLADFYRKTSFRPPHYPLPEWLTAQNPLSIPYEEHVVGAELAKSLLFLSKPENSTLRAEFFDKFYDDYCRLLRMHIDKEDNCLFIICERALA